MLGRDSSELLSRNWSDKERRAWRLLTEEEAAGDSQATQRQEWRVLNPAVTKGQLNIRLLSVAAESTSRGHQDKSMEERGSGQPSEKQVAFTLHGLFLPSLL